MSKTYWISRGEKIRPNSYMQKKKAAKTKFMGRTKGEHSRGVTERKREIVGGQSVVVYIKVDRAPIKGEDFIKYDYKSGFSMHHEPKSVVKNKHLIRQMQIELRNYGN